MIRAFLKKVGLISKAEKRRLSKSGDKSSPRIIPRQEHGISRANISDNALKVLYRLHQHGFDAYLVGGGVRDLLLGLHPKDFDVVTNAKPEEVRRVFRNCRLIGRRFRLAHIYFGQDIVEVATFRGIEEGSKNLSHSEQGMILRDNVYGTISEDVWRRDFTVNALYYNIADFSLVDFVGGYEDLKAKRLLMIGDAAQRYREDPVRMLRAIRFACKAGLSLPKELTAPMAELKGLISHVSAARLFEEMRKMFHTGAAFAVYEKLKELNLFSELFPLTAECLQQDIYPTDGLLKCVLQNTDNRIQQEKTVTLAFIVAALLWHPILLQAQRYIDDGMALFPARVQAMEDMLHRQSKRVSIPKRIAQGARDIWLLQMRLMKRQGKRAQELFEEPRFRAAFDFLELRAKAGEDVQELAKWWQDYTVADAAGRHALVKVLGPGRKRKKFRRKVNETK